MNWIKVTDRLPEKGQYIDVITNSEKYDLCIFRFPDCVYEDGNFYTIHGAFQIFDVTHWMPLPEPPKD